MLPSCAIGTSLSEVVLMSLSHLSGLLSERIGIRFISWGNLIKVEDVSWISSGVWIKCSISLVDNHINITCILNSQFWQVNAVYTYNNNQMVIYIHIYTARKSNVDFVGKTYSSSPNSETRVSKLYQSFPAVNTTWGANFGCITPMAQTLRPVWLH